MAQTKLNYNELMFGQNGEPFRYQNETITGSADLKAGSIIVPNGSGKYRAAVDADLVLATNVMAGWRVLLEDATVSKADVVAKTGVSGGVYFDKLIAVTGLASVSDEVINRLAVNNIYVTKGTDTAVIAGE